MTDTATVERTTTDLLKAQVFAAYQSRKFTAIWDLFEMQIALVTELEGIRQQAHERTVRERARISELKATNAALVEFVKACDAFADYRVPGTWQQLADRADAARQTLATDHGIPLPGEGVGS
jgi:hypothetical protein